MIIFATIFYISLFDRIQNFTGLSAISSTFIFWRGAEVMVTTYVWDKAKYEKEYRSGILQMWIPGSILTLISSVQFF